MRFFAAIPLLVLALCAPFAAHAQTAAAAPTLLQEYNDWEAYRHEADGQVVCYILSKPTTMTPANRKHGDVFFFLTSRPSDNVVNEASVLVGYPFEPESNVTVDIDGDTFSLFTKDDGAWVESTADEQQLVAAMRAGRQMTVRGKSARGTETVYTFSLSGVTAGSNRIANGCES